MYFEWDETKRRSNLRKHGIDFVDAAKVLAGPTLTIEDDRLDYGEQRYLTVGLLRGHVVSISHTETDECFRLISMRNATSNETKDYFQQIAD